MSASTRYRLDLLGGAFLFGMAIATKPYDYSNLVAGIIAALWIFQGWVGIGRAARANGGTRA